MEPPTCPSLIWGVAGAKAIDGQRLNRIEVHGKNLFYFFGEGPGQVVMHIHFGMSGHFRTSPFPGPETTPTTRLRLTSQALGIVAHLSAMTVQHGDLGEGHTLCLVGASIGSAMIMSSSNCQSFVA